MAEHSKEFDEELGDFSIREILDSLEPGYQISQICEGFGFYAIRKNINGGCEVAMQDKNDPDYVVWKKFDFLTNTIEE